MFCRQMSRTFCADNISYLSAGVFLLFIFVFVSCCSFVKTTAPAKASRIVGGEKSNRNRFENDYSNSYMGLIFKRERFEK